MKRTEEEKAERRADYKRYLKSRIWAAIRGAAIHRAGGKCEHCRGTEQLHVHHAKYPQVFGTETPEMLRVLCDACHAEEHGRPYILIRQTKQQRKARGERFRAIKREKGAAKRAARKARSARFRPTEPTPPLKDRY